MLTPERALILWEIKLFYSNVNVVICDIGSQLYTVETLYKIITCQPKYFSVLCLPSKVKK